MFEAALAKEIALYGFCGNLAITYGFMPKARTSEMITGWHLQNILEERERAYKLYVDNYKQSSEEQNFDTAFCLAKIHQKYRLTTPSLSTIVDDVEDPEKIKTLVDETIEALKVINYEDE